MTQLAANPSKMDPDDALVECRDVARSFGSGPTAVVAVHGVSCRVLPAAKIALTGPSGSGKSTLLHMMAGLEQPTAGSLSWPALGGHPLGHPNRVGIIFQGPSLLPALDVIENVVFPLLLGDVAEAEAMERAHAALDLLSIDGLARALPDQLSGGQAQRVAVARVLAARPRLILADEPTGQLDLQAASTVMDVLLKVSAELGAGLVVSTHDPRIAERLAVQWAMRDGALVAAQVVAA